MVESYINLIEKELRSYKYGDQPGQLYEPIRYILSLGGKRLRPVLALMSCELFDNDFRKALSPALGIEVFHNFTLIHDDIMDNAPLRRGKETVHEKWDDNTAILSGDVMLIKAYELIAKTESKYLKQIFYNFNLCATGVCEGQQYDMNFETMETVTEEEYIKMIRLKTAILLAFSLETGAIIGGASEENSKLLYDFGINIGIGFQLKDDLLDVFGDAQKFGKQVGGDIISNKKTYLLIKALELASGSSKNTLQDWLNKEEFDPQQKVNAVKSIYDDLNIQQIAEEKMNQYFDHGLALFDSIKIDEAKKKALRKLTIDLIDREM